MAATQNQTQHLSSTAQQYLEIADITNDLLILKDGSAAMVLELSAINFGLLSEPEQDAIIYAYAALINSLSFPIQIVISSRPKDVSQYLEYIDEQLQGAPTDVRRNQIAAYRQFVANLITEQNVLDKNFFVVISLAAIEVGVSSPGGLLNVFVPNATAPKIDKTVVVEKAVNILGPRRDHLLNQFARFGLHAQQLNTKELIHEFYVLYNGQAAEGAKIVDTSEYTTPLIQTYGGQPQPAAAPSIPGLQPFPQAQQPQPAPTPAPAAPQPAPTPTPAPAAPVSTPTVSAQVTAQPKPNAPITPAPSPAPARPGLGAAVAAIPTETPGAPQTPTQPR